LRLLSRLTGSLFDDGVADNNTLAVGGMCPGPFDILVFVLSIRINAPRPVVITNQSDALSPATVGQFYCCGNLFADGGVPGTRGHFAPASSRRACDSRRVVGDSQALPRPAGRSSSRYRYSRGVCRADVLHHRELSGIERPGREPKQERMVDQSALVLGRPAQPARVDRTITWGWLLTPSHSLRKSSGRAAREGARHHTHLTYIGGGDLARLRISGHLAQ
jgi:hypothetical protein